MIRTIEKAEYVERYLIRLQFDDGLDGTIDLEEELWGEIFEPLKDLNVFSKVVLDKELNTIRWENGADFAPEFLYEMASAQQSDGADRGGSS